MFIKLLACVAAVAITIAATLAHGQTIATVLTPGTSGSTTTVAGLLFTWGLHRDNATARGVVFPYHASSMELGNRPTTDRVVLLRSSDTSATHFVAWNFTEAESATIKTWLRSLRRRNNIEVSFVAAWGADGRFPINTDSWTITQPSLMPYGIRNTCNVTAAQWCKTAVVNQRPIECGGSGLTIIRQCFTRMPECMVITGKIFAVINNYCRQNRDVVNTLFCTDGAPGGTAICDFIRDAQPTGTPMANDEEVTTVGSDGMPTSGRVGSGSAGASATAAVAVLAAVLALAF